MAAQSYFKQCVNVLDFVMTILCIFFFIIFVEETSPNASAADLPAVGELETVDVALLILRYSFQLGRLSLLIYRSRQTTTFLVQEEVDFHQKQSVLPRPGHGGSSGLELASLTSHGDHHDSSSFPSPHGDGGGG